MEKSEQHPAVRGAAALAALALAFAGGPVSARQAGGEPASEQVWMLQVIDGKAFLAYATPESDDIGMTLDCRLGSGRIGIWTDLDKTDTLRLRSGGLDHIYPSVFRTNEETGSERTGTAKVDDPVLAAFSRTGALAVGKRDPYAAASAKERDAIAKFFQACARLGK